MKTDKDLFMDFLRQINGDYNNAVLVDCKECSENCSGHLLVCDSEGTPNLYSLDLLNNFSEQIIKKENFSETISKGTFEKIFRKWLTANKSRTDICSMLQFRNNADIHLPNDF